MDDLEFRRNLYADPSSSDQHIEDAIARDPAKQEFRVELLKLDASLRHAAKIDVPEDLAHKLILQQSMQRFQRQKKRNRVHLAMAASVAFVVGVSFTMWQQDTLLDMSAHAMAHVYHTESHELYAQGDVSFEQINNKLGSLVNARLEQGIGRVYSANFCDIENVRTLHLVMQGEQGRVTVYIVPAEDSYTTNPSFTDDRFSGKAVQLGKANLLMVGEKGESFGGLESKLRSNLIFSA